MHIMHCLSLTVNNTLKNEHQLISCMPYRRLEPISFTAQMISDFFCNAGEAQPSTLFLDLEFYTWHTQAFWNKTETLESHRHKNTKKRISASFLLKQVSERETEMWFLLKQFVSTPQMALQCRHTPGSCYNKKKMAHSGTTYYLSITAHSSASHPYGYPTLNSVLPRASELAHPNPI